jgi:hypothetical protein
VGSPEDQASAQAASKGGIDFASGVPYCAMTPDDAYGAMIPTNTSIMTDRSARI